MVGTIHLATIWIANYWKFAIQMFPLFRSPLYTGVWNQYRPTHNYSEWFDVQHYFLELFLLGTEMPWAEKWLYYNGYSNYFILVWIFKQFLLKFQVMDACLRCQAESKVDARSSGSAAKVFNKCLFWLLTVLWCPYEKSNFGRRRLSQILAKDVYVTSMQTCLLFRIC